MLWLNTGMVIGEAEVLNRVNSGELEKKSQTLLFTTSLVSISVIFGINLVCMDRN